MIEKILILISWLIIVAIISIVFFTIKEYVEQDYSYFVSYIYIDKNNNSGIGNIYIQTNAKIDDLERIRDIEKLICDDNIKKAVVINYKYMGRCKPNDKKQN